MHSFIQKDITKAEYSLDKNFSYDENQEAKDIPDQLNSKDLECKLCKKIFSGSESQKQHLKSKRHLNLLKDSFLVSKENQIENEMENKLDERSLLYSNKSSKLEASDSLIENEMKYEKIDSTEEITVEEILCEETNQKIPSILECKLCKKIFTGIESQNQHFQSRRHIDLLNNHHI